MFYVIPAIYLAFTLILGVFCVFATVLVVRTHFREENIPIPKWVRKMITCCCIPVSFWNGCCNRRSEVNPERIMTTASAFTAEIEYFLGKMWPPF